MHQTQLHLQMLMPTDALRAAKVVASFEERQAIIDQQVKALADEVNAIAIVPADLRDEVTALVEWPVALRASFEERFLAVPQEALITTMQDNQKYFCLVNSDHKLQPYFITVSNIESKDPKQIIEGNEKLFAHVCQMPNSSFAGSETAAGFTFRKTG